MLTAGGAAPPRNSALQAFHDFLESMGLQQIGQSGVWVGLDRPRPQLTGPVEGPAEEP